MCGAAVLELRIELADMEHAAHFSETVIDSAKNRICGIGDIGDTRIPFTGLAAIMDDGIGQHVIEMPGLATQRQTDRQTDRQTQRHRDRQINLGQAPTCSSFEGDM